MLNKFIIVIFISTLILSTSIASAKSPDEERGIYIYDEANRITIESELGLSAYLWKLDLKTGYEMVVVFPTEKMTEEQMENWYNAHGVGKKDKNNGLALFIFPDNTAFGMIGKENDRIAVPYVSTYGKRTLSTLNKEPVVAVLGFVTTIGKKLDEPTVTEIPVNMTRTVVANMDIILLFLFIISLMLVLLQQGDGFQMSDFILPSVLCILSVFVIVIMSAGSDYVNTTSNEYGVITSTNLDSYVFSETHSYPCGKNTCYRTDWHTMYTNEVRIKSYDFREYGHKFSSRDSKRSWQIVPDDKVQITITNKNELVGVSLNIDDNSGGKTDRYGTWINTK